MAAPSLPVSAVIFDCDGVLVNSEEIAQEVEVAMLSAIGLHYDRREYMTRFMGTSEDAWWQGLEDDAMARLGRSIRQELEHSLNAKLRAEFQARLAEIPGAAAAISRVRQLRAVASSSGTTSLALKLKTVGHWNLFAPHVYSADHVKASKPAPDLFLHAAAALGVEASRCVVIEDSLNGVLAARAAAAYSRSRTPACRSSPVRSSTRDTLPSPSRTHTSSRSSVLSEKRSGADAKKVAMPSPTRSTSR